MIKNIKIGVFFIILTSFNVKLFAQKEANIWYFGTFAGIDFNGPTPILLTDGQINAHEGCASIADENGDLLFYTNGVDVWNKGHNIMSNGTGLKGHISSTQSAIVVPKPDVDSIYYIFTVDEYLQGNMGANGLNFSEVNINANGGFGEVILSTKNTPLLQPTTEKLTTVKHKNCRDTWVVVHDLGDSFYAYLVSPNGIALPVISSVGAVTAGGGNAIGCLKASPKGEYLVAVNVVGNPELLEFDNSTGIITQSLSLDAFGNRPAYGTEFSSNGDVLYVASLDNNLYQYDLSAADIPGSELLVGTSSGGTAPVASDNVMATAQLAPDGKIYIAKPGSFLDVINNPNSLGTACNFINDGFSISPSTIRYGLPQFSASFDSDPTITSTGPFCEEDTVFNLTALNNGGSWIGSGISDPTDGTFNPFLAGVGAHQIIHAIPRSCQGSDTISVVVNPSDTAEFSYANTTFCLTDPNPFPNITKTLGGTFTINNSGIIDPVSGVIDLEASGAGAYLVTYKTNGICLDSTTANININDGVDATITNMGPFCEGDNAENLIAVDSNGVWMGIGITDSIVGTFDPQIAGVGIHQIIYTVSTLCGNAIDTTMIIVNPTPSVNFNVDTNSLCVKPGALFTFVNSSNNSGGTIGSANWNFGDGSSVVEGDTVSYTYSNPGVYDITLTITNNIGAGGCVSDSTKLEFITVFPNPIADFDMNPNPANSIDPVVSFFDLSEPSSTISSWNWTFDEFGISGEQDPIFTFLEDTGNYTVTLTIEDNNNCRDSISKNLIVLGTSALYLPNTFSPNGDGVNDLYIPVFSGIVEYFFRIFDRWGEIIFKTSDFSESWDGTKNGKPVQEDTYIWKIDYIDINGFRDNKTGHINLIK